MDVLILSGRLFIAEALAELLDADQRVGAVEIASGSLAAERAISRDRSFRLVIDLDHPPLHPTTLVAALQEANTERRVGIYDAFTPLHAQSAFDIGLTVLAPLSMELEDLCTAVLGIQPPSSVTVPDGIDREALLRLTSLTARESEVLSHAIYGMKVREIANELSITPHTVQTHKRRMFAKLGVQSQAQAITLATRAGLGPLNRESDR